MALKKQIGKLSMKIKNMGMQKCIGEHAMVDPKLTLGSIQCLIMESILNFIRLQFPL